MAETSDGLPRCICPWLFTDTSIGLCCLNAQILIVFRSIQRMNLCIFISIGSFRDSICSVCWFCCFDYTIDRIILISCLYSGCTGFCCYGSVIIVCLDSVCVTPSDVTFVCIALPMKSYDVSVLLKIFPFLSLLVFSVSRPMASVFITDVSFSSPCVVVIVCVVPCTVSWYVVCSTESGAPSFVVVTVVGCPWSS